MPRESVGDEVEGHGQQSNAGGSSDGGPGLEKNKKEKNGKKNEKEDGQILDSNDDWNGRRTALKKKKADQKELEEMDKHLKKIKTVEQCRDAYDAADLEGFDSAIPLNILRDRLAVFATEEGLDKGRLA